MKIMHGLLLLVPFATLAGCADPVSVESVPCDPLLSTFSEAGADTVTAELEVRYVDLRQGDGVEADWGDVARVNYSGYTAEQSLFDTSCFEDRAPLPFQLGTGGIIPGFQIGIVGMRANGVRRVMVPAAQAYGEQDLIFDIQLLSIE